MRGRLPSADAQTAWLGFVDDVPSPFSSVQVYNPALGGDLVTGDIFDVAREVVITLGKQVTDGCAFFIFQSGIPQYLARRAVLPRLAIADFSSVHAFRARGLEVASWDLAQPTQSPDPLLGPIDPTRYVRDFVPDREVVADLNPWMMVTAPTQRIRGELPRAGALSRFRAGACWATRDYGLSTDGRFRSRLKSSASACSEP